MRKNLRVAGYARVSTDEQKKYGYSIQAQTEEITQWCNDNDHDLIHIYIDEGFSASTMKRPQLQAMLSNLKNLDAIAFTRLDRLSRNVLEANKMLELLQQNGVAMISICEDDINTSTRCIPAPTKSTMRNLQRKNICCLILIHCLKIT